MSEKPPYWHETIKSKADYDRLVEEKGECYTIGDLLKDFRQPDWCNYPDALAGTMGCWSLWGFHVTGKDYCSNCEEAAHYKKEESR